MRLKILIFLFVILNASSLCSAQQLSFQSFTSTHGLSQNSGYCITQDAQGFIWMGTQDGLNKFNGNTITTYYKENFNRGTLADNFITSLLYDSVNNFLWIGTAAGLCYYNCKTDSFYDAGSCMQEADTLSSLFIRSIVAGRTPFELVVVTLNEGLFICNTKSHTAKQFFQQPETKNSTNAATVWDNEIVAVVNKKLYFVYETPKLILDDVSLNEVRKLHIWQNKLWIASIKNGVMVIADKQHPVIAKFNCSSNDVGTFITDQDNNLWIGTRTAGIEIIEPEKFNIIHSYSTAPNQNEWPKKFTLSLFKDRQHNIWIGSSGGGFSVNTHTKKEFNLIQKSEIQFGKAAHNMILSMYKPDGDLLYMGTQLEGLRIHNLNTGITQNALNNNIPSGNSIYSITAWANNLWLATTDGLFEYNTTTKKYIHFTDSSIKASTAGQSVYKILNHDSLLYSGINGTAFFNLSDKKFKPFTGTYSNHLPVKLTINKFCEDSDGNIWMGCQLEGLVKYNLIEKQLKRIDEIATISKTVNSIYKTDNNLWLGTNNGLIIFNYKTNNVLKTFSVADGLPGNVIYSIEKGSDGNLWCGSNSGLIKIDSKSNKIIQIRASAGLQGDEFNTACSSSDQNGNIYFGGINGVTYFNPSNFTVNYFSPTPHIESIKIANKILSLPLSINYTNEIKLSHSQNFITLEYGVNNFVNHDECLYEYFLKGVDADWVKAGNRTYVNYSGLKPGTYTFYLKSCNSYGIWSKKINELKIIIEPAWWQTWWCMLLTTLFVLSILTFAILNRIKSIRYKAEIKQKITETEMAALKAQMNPHFMFNCINSIDAFIHSNDKYNATLYLNKFARLLRNILDSSKQNTVSFNKDIITLQLYVELEELRHENKFKTVFNVDDELLNSDYKVPPLIVQPFVENAILHGLKNRTDNNGILTIDIKKAGDWIEYTIMDNGIGRKAAGLIGQNKESSYGMQMSYERIRLFNQEKEAAVAVTDLYQSGKAAGTLIKVHIKII